MRTLIPLLLFPLFASCAKYALDAEVDRLCAIDGGVKVYETVMLPPEKFNEWGQINFYQPIKGENALGPEYLYRSEDHYYRKGNPSMVRYHHQVFRRSDGTLLGETTSYGRGGGEWAPSSYNCPPTSKSSEQALFKKIFIKSHREQQK